MMYLFFLLALSLWSINYRLHAMARSLTGTPQHDPHVLVHEISQDLAVKGWEFLEKSWQDYKKEHPEQEAKILGDCLEFDLYLIEKYKSADSAYNQFEGRSIAPRLTYAYAQTRYELENQKNIANFAVLLCSQLRALALKKKCEPKDKFVPR